MPNSIKKRAEEMTIDEIVERLKQIVEALESDSSDDSSESTEELEEESRGLQNELERRNNLERRKGIAERINNSTIAVRNVTPNTSDSDDYYGSIEYRKSYMNYVLKGEKLQTRADAVTMTTDVDSVIPTTIMNKIYEKIESYGDIYARITKTNFKGGLAIPVSSLKPSASWVSEGTTSDKQKKSTGKIVFAYYKLQCKVSLTMETTIVTLDIFEDTVAKNIAEAMVKAIDASVWQGTGKDQPTGILNDSKITVETLSAKPDYAKLVKIESNVDEAYDSSAEYYMTKKDFFNDIIGLTDENGQPIARVNIGIDGKPQPTLFGRPVNYEPSDTLGDVYMAVGDLSDYVFNSNLQMTTRKYFDEDTDEEVTKCTLIGDGQLAHAQSFQLFKYESA